MLTPVEPRSPLVTCSRLAILTEIFAVTMFGAPKPPLKLVSLAGDGTFAGSHQRRCERSLPKAATAAWT